MGTPHRTPRCPHFPRLQPHLLPTAQEGSRSVIEEALMAASSPVEGGECPGGTLHAPVRYSPVSCSERSMATGSLQVITTGAFASVRARSEAAAISS